MKLRIFRNEARDDYLEAILQITQKKGYCRSIDIAEELDVSKPSVSVAVGKLLESGLVLMGDDKRLVLTEEGQRLAEQTYAKHLYFKSFLLSVGVEEPVAEREACALEPAISSDTFQMIRERFPAPPSAKEI